jgi:hypothetical protein
MVKVCQKFVTDNNREPNELEMGPLRVYAEQYAAQMIGIIVHVIKLYLNLYLYL